MGGEREMYTVIEVPNTDYVLRMNAYRPIDERYVSDIIEEIQYYQKLIDEYEAAPSYLRDLAREYRREFQGYCRGISAATSCSVWTKEQLEKREARRKVLREELQKELEEEANRK